MLHTTKKNYFLQIIIILLASVITYKYANENRVLAISAFQLCMYYVYVNNL